jgi:hypothetical protein
MQNFSVHVLSVVDLKSTMTVQENTFANAYRLRKLLKLSEWRSELSADGRCKGGGGELCGWH